LTGWFGFKAINSSARFFLGTLLHLVSCAAFQPSEKLNVGLHILPNSEGWVIIVLVKAIVTRDHRLDGLNTEMYCLTALEAKTP
jgi:hypothetical protein